MIDLSLYLTYHSKKVFSQAIRRLQSQQQFLQWVLVLSDYRPISELFKKNT